MNNVQMCILIRIPSKSSWMFCKGTLNCGISPPCFLNITLCDFFFQIFNNIGKVCSTVHKNSKASSFHITGGDVSRLLHWYPLYLHQSYHKEITNATWYKGNNVIQGNCSNVIQGHSCKPTMTLGLPVLQQYVPKIILVPAVTAMCTNNDLGSQSSNNNTRSCRLPSSQGKPSRYDVPIQCFLFTLQSEEHLKRFGRCTL